MIFGLNIDQINSLTKRIKICESGDSDENIGDIVQEIKTLVMKGELTNEDANGLLLLIHNNPVNDIDDGEGNDAGLGFHAVEQKEPLKIQDEFADIFEESGAIQPEETDGFFSGFGSSNPSSSTGDVFGDPIDDFAKFE